MTGAKNLLCAKEVRNLPPCYGLFTLNGPMGAVSTDRRGRAHLAWAIRVLFAAAIALTLSYLPYRIVAQPGEQKLRDMNVELRRVRSEIESSKVAVGKRRRHVEALKTDTRTIEDIARHDLQMVYPHEKTLRLSTTSSVAK
jgi:cell division protein FtsB